MVYVCALKNGYVERPFGVFLRSDMLASSKVFVCALISRSKFMQCMLVLTQASKLKSHVKQVCGLESCKTASPCSVCSNSVRYHLQVHAIYAGCYDKPTSSKAGWFLLVL